MAESSDKGAGTPFSAVCSNILTRPASPSLSGIIDVPPSPAPQPVSPLSRKKKSSVKKFSAKSRASSGAKQSVAGLCRRLDADLGAAASGASAGDASSPAARSSAAPVRSSVSTARKGLRSKNNAEPFRSVRSIGLLLRTSAPRYLPVILSRAFSFAFFA